MSTDYVLGTIYKMNSCVRHSIHFPHNPNPARKTMSTRPQIHMFFGAPILSTAPSNPKEENDSLANEKPWRELHLSFTNDTFNLCSASFRPLDHETATDAALVVNSKGHFPVNFEKRGGSVDAFMTDCATSVGGVKSFSHVGQRCKKDYTKGNAGCILDNHLDTSPLVFEVKDLKNCMVDDHNPSYLQGEPQGENLGQYLKACSEKADESKPGNPSNLGLSTDNEFLSILTLSQVALCSGQYAVGQNEMQNQLTAGEGVELALPCREDTADGEPLLKSDEDGEMAAKKVDTNCEANSDCSIELFDSDNSGQDNSNFKKCSPVSSPVNNEGRDLKPQQKRQLCSPKDHHAERSQASGDNATTSRFTFGDRQLSKRIKLACSPLRPVKRNKKTRVPGIEKAQKKLSLLKDCVEKSGKFSVLVVVLHPCHIKEIKMGSNASRNVPLATVVVADPSEVRQKIVLWRAAAFLSLTVFPGDIVLFRGESVKHICNRKRGIYICLVFTITVLFEQNPGHDLA